MLILDVRDVDLDCGIKLDTEIGASTLPPKIP
jgi:hypothetical protein